MFRNFRKKKNPQRPTTINPNIEATLQNATRVRHSQQITKKDQTRAQGQTQDNQIVAGPSTSTLVDQASDQLPASTSTADRPSTSTVVDQASDHLSALAGPSTSTLVDQASSDHLAASTSTADEQLQVIPAQALPRKGSRNRISSSVSIGQDQAFNEVGKFLAENDVRMLGIYGMGGVGKTTLMNKIWTEVLEPSDY